MNRQQEPSGSLRLTRTQRLAWLRLIRSENVGPATFRDLVNHYGTAENALDALPELSRRGGRSAISLCSLEDAETELRAHEKAGCRLVALGEAGYPPHLRHIDGPPPLLSVLGGDALAQPRMLAVVGARNASLSGRKFAASLSGSLSSDGFVIASGLARGIDASAHQAALGGGTVAVFAGGVDVLYPPEHDELLAAILHNGGNVISEMPLGWKPRGRDFPRRNRLISGISLGVVVIEAARASGSLHTARFAIEQNREIFAVPGSPLDPRSEGANRLIQQGATLITSSDDVLESLTDRIEPVLPLVPGIADPGQNSIAAPHEPAEPARALILSALGPTPVEVDELARFTGETVRTVQVLLLELELAGRLERHSGQRVSLLY